MNYSELTQAVKDYTENTETTFVTNIPVFVRQAEERIYRDVIIPELRKNSTGSTSASNPYLARPSDFLSTLSLAVIDSSSNYTYLLEKEVNFIKVDINDSDLPKIGENDILVHDIKNTAKEEEKN